MSAFADFYVDFLWSLLKNIGSFFASIGKMLYKFFVTDVGGYFKDFGIVSKEFGAFGWICFILVAIVSSVFVVFLFYRFILLLRRYIFHRSREVKKDKLMQEIAKLQLQTEELAKENSKILSKKLSPTVSALMDEAAASDMEIGTMEPRFPRLLEMDRDYIANPMQIYMGDEDMLGLSEIVRKFVDYSASQLGLYYEEDTVRLFFAALATSKVIILEGVPGSGKTTLPYALGKFFKNEPSIIPVESSWRDRNDLVGYFDEFSKHFTETSFLCGLYAATLRQDPNFIILDDMNFARVEYYFSDVLAMTDVADIGEWKLDLVPSYSPSDPANIVFGKLLVSQNVWFVGTVTSEENSFLIPDEVYDRAVTIDLNGKAEPFEAPYTESYNCTYFYLESLFNRAYLENAISEENCERIRLLDVYMREKCNIAFGNRIMRQIGLFVPTYVACGGSEIAGIDFIICSKVLRKFTTINLEYVYKELDGLVSYIQELFGKGNMYYCVEYLTALQKM